MNEPPPTTSIPKIAVSYGIVPRAAWIAVLYGTILLMAEQRAALLGAGPVDLLPAVLGYGVTFIVLVASQTAGIRSVFQALFGGAFEARDGEGFLRTAAEPAALGRSLLLAVILGGSGAAFALLWGPGGELARPLLIQRTLRFVIPMFVVSLISQTIAIRRARTRVAERLRVLKQVATDAADAARGQA